VHVHMRHCYAYIKMAQILFRGKYKILFHDHYGDIEINKVIPIHLKSLLRPEYYVGVSNALVEWAKNDLKIKAANVFYLPNTIIPDTTVNYEHVSGKKSVCLVSNIRETKNIEFAIALCKQLDMHLTIFGNKADDKYYRKIIDSIDGDKRINIIQGETEIYKKSNSYSLAIHCAKSETGPLVLLEYMAYGIPFVAYKTGDIANTIASKLPQHFVYSFKIDEWKNKIEELNKNNVSDSLKKIFRKYFSPEKYINECLEIYQKVIS
jgi:glycosyltransferase involved in cell wall biosynthesis